MTTLRAIQAAERRREREAQKRQRELERQAKEQAKLSAIERARLEVETYEKRVELLRSVHKEQSEVWDWPAVAASLPPPRPQTNSFHEQKANQRFVVLKPEEKETAQGMLEQARMQDEQDFKAAMQSYTEQMTEWEKLKNMARRILAGEHKAYTQALVEFNPFADISDLGSSINFTVHNAKLVECVLKVNGRTVLGSSRIACVIVPAVMKGVRSCGMRGVFGVAAVWLANLILVAGFAVRNGVMSTAAMFGGPLATGVNVPCASMVVPCGIEPILTRVGPSAGAAVGGTLIQIPGST